MGEEIFSKELSTFKKEINFISNLYINRKLPQTILFTGEKGIGKLNVAYHLINFIYEIYIMNFTIVRKSIQFPNNEKQLI